MNFLIMGPPGSGKSTIGRMLRDRGYNFVEADIDTYKGRSIAYFVNKETGEGVDMPWPRPKGWGDENDWVWRADVLEEMLAEWPDKTNFVCGDAHNKQDAYHLFHRIFALSTSDEILRERILARTDNYYGKDPEEFADVVRQNSMIKAEAKRAGAIVIDALQSEEDVVKTILEAIN